MEEQARYIWLMVRLYLMFCIVRIARAKGNDLFISGQAVAALEVVRLSCTVPAEVSEGVKSACEGGLSSFSLWSADGSGTNLFKRLFGLKEDVLLFLNEIAAVSFCARDGYVFLGERCSISDPEDDVFGVEIKTRLVNYDDKAFGSFLLTHFHGVQTEAALIRCGLTNILKG